MMMTSKNSRLAGLKKILILPVLAVLFVSFTKEKENHITENFEENSVNQIYSIPEISTIKLENIQKNIEDFAEGKFTIKSDTVRKEEKKVAENSHSASALPKVLPVAHQNFTGTLPVFPGGINEFRTLVSSNFDTSHFKGNEGLLKATIFIDIDENGKMSNVRSTGEDLLFNKEAEKSVQAISSNTIWEPAKQDGQAVKYVFKLPLTMQFAEPVTK